MLLSIELSDFVDPSAETVINAMPYDASKSLANAQPVNAAASDIRQRLSAAAELYLAAQRDTVGG